MRPRSPSPSAAIRVLCAAPIVCAALAAQVPPGHAIGAQRGTAPNAPATLFVYEPLIGTTRAIGDPGNQLAQTQAIALTRSRAELLVALGSASSSVVHRVTLVGETVGTVTAISQAFTAPIVRLLPLPDGRAVVATTQAVFSLPATGGAATRIFGTDLTDSLVDLVLRRDDGAQRDLLIGLARRSTGGSAVYVHSSVGLMIRAIAIASPAALELDPTRDSLLVGNLLGEIWLVEASRLTLRFLTVTPRNLPVTALRFNTDQGDVAVGAGTLLLRLSGNALGSPTVAPGSGPVRTLDYARYESRFVAYGTNCSGAGAAPRIGASGRPFPGNGSFAVTLSGGAADRAASLILGLVASNVPLDGAGMPGCLLLVAPLDLIPAQTSATGRASLRLPIPPIPDLAGADVFFQWLAAATGANRLDLLTSDGGRAEF